MTHITAMKLALEALEWDCLYAPVIHTKAIAALTAAMAEPSKPVAIAYVGNMDHGPFDIAPTAYGFDTLKNKDKLYTHPPVPEPESGPDLTIAYMSGFAAGKKAAAQPSKPEPLSDEIKRLTTALTLSNKTITAVANDGLAAINRKDAALQTALEWFEWFHNKGHSKPKVSSVEIYNQIKEALE
jgi:hypothetical protein